MPASSSETRNRWRKRKREPQITRKSKPQPQEDDDVLDDEDEDDLDLDHQNPQSEFDEEPNNCSDPAAAAAGPRESEVLSDGGVPVSKFPPAVKYTVNRHHPSVLAVARGQNANGTIVLENLSYGQLQALSTVGDLDSGAYVITPPPIMEGRAVVKSFGPNRVHVVPMHADWFSPTTVNRLERQAVPHFFSGKSADHTPEKYMECRNHILVTYMGCPANRVSASDFHNRMVGIDADDISRIVRFLDKWGIINYCAAPNCDRKTDGDSYLTEDSKGELCVPAKALKSIDSLIRFDKPKCRLKAADIYPSLVGHGDDNSDLDSRIRDQLSENRCNHCSQPLAVVYYRSQKEVDVLLCLDCFNEGVFVAGHSSLDFIRADSTKDYGDLVGDSWTDQETLLLLEAMELYNENWNEIAEHVGTKTKAQCILHFVRLSIDDAPLENIEVPSMSNSSNFSNGDVCGRSDLITSGNAAGPSFEGPEIENRLPFANSGNPVMSQVAFLASAVGPRVAAACAHASLAALSEDDRLTASGNTRVTDGSGYDNRESNKGCGLQAENTNSVHQKEENYGVQSPQTQVDADVAPLPSEKVKNAARAGLAAAAMKAKLFADHEEREIQRLAANIINHQLKRLELKLKQFAEVETLLMKECEQVERGRQRIAAERALMLSSQFGQSGMTRPTGLPNIGPAMVNNNAGSSRQQTMGAPSQPFISGYGSNQPIHPHMSQQPMYGLGPRLPLSAINPSSSSVTAHPMLRPVSGSRPSFE